MLLGLRSRWTTPAEWTYFRPRYKSVSTAGYSCKSEHAYQDLVEEVLDELLLKRSRGEQAVQISTKEFGDEVAVFCVRKCLGRWGSTDIHILEGRDKDITEGDNLRIISIFQFRPKSGKRTFSCFRCFKSFNSRYVLLDKTGVLKGFIIFLTATFWPVS